MQCCSLQFITRACELIDLGIYTLVGVCLFGEGGGLGL